MGGRNLFSPPVVYSLQMDCLRRILTMSLLPCRSAGIRLILVCAAVLAVATCAPRAQAEEVTKAYTVSGRANVRVDTNDGSVRVTSGGDAKQVEFKVEYQ